MSKMKQERNQQTPSMHYKCTEEEAALHRRTLQRNTVAFQTNAVSMADEQVAIEEQPANPPKHKAPGRGDGTSFMNHRIDEQVG